LTEVVLIDSNVPMYAVGADHPYREPCIEVLQRIRTGALDAATDAEVHQEILYRYLSVQQATRARQVSEAFQVLVPTVFPITIAEIARARELVDRYPTLPARDLLHLAAMLNNGITTIVSADRHFDVVSEIRRRDPSAI
jgi:uncharacterized protein